MTRISFESHRYSGARLIGITLLAALMLTVSNPASAAGPPANRNYFVIVLGLEGPYSWQATCLTFTRDEVCTSFGDCGIWSRSEAGPDGAFSFEIEATGDEPAVRFEGEMRIETRGKREAIGGTARATLGEEAFTVALSGRSTTRKTCRDLLTLWEEASE